jgi:hypothetical protein
VHGSPFDHRKYLGDASVLHEELDVAQEKLGAAVGGSAGGSRTGNEKPVC